MRIKITTMSDFLQELTERGPNLEPVVRWRKEMNRESSSSGRETIWYLHVEYLREITPDLRAMVVIRETLYTGRDEDFDKEMEHVRTREGFVLREITEIAATKHFAVVGHSQYEEVPF